MIYKTIFLTIAVSFAFVYSYQDISELTFLEDFEDYTYEARNGNVCVEDGFMCENCTTIAFCFFVGGNYSKEIVGTCPDDSTCKDGVCTTVPDEECDVAVNEYEFECHQPGTFPDPFDCKYYHVCTLDGGAIVPESVKIRCPVNFGYDAYRGVCRIPLVDDKCPSRPIEPCTGPGSGPVPGNPSLFYLCLAATINGKQIYQPQFFVCQNNYEYYNNSCRDPHPRGIDAGRCIAVGKFYYKDDCRKYYECETTGIVPVVRTCPLNNMFNAKIANCEVFPCPR